MGTRKEQGKHYQVISLAVSGKSKAFKLHDKVREADFEDGHADKLVGAGHLKELKAKPKAEVKEKESSKKEDKS